MGQTLAMLVLLAGQPAPDVSRADPGAPQVATLQPPPLQSEVDDLRRRLADLERRLQPAEPPTAAPPPVPAADDGRDVFRFRWRNGLIGETPDGQYQVHLGGRLQSDYAWYSVPDRVQNSLSTPLQDGVTLRRVRLETDGVLWKTFEFALHVDFARTSDLRELSDDPDANVYITDAYIGLRDVPWLGTVRVGHQKEALTFEGATSSRFLPFMERSLVFDGLNDPYIYGTGLSLRQSWFDERLTLWSGVFKPNSRTGGFGVGDGQIAVDCRLHGFPIYDEDGKRWAYLGAGASFRPLPDDRGHITVRPQVRSGSRFQVPNLADSGEVFSRSELSAFSVGGFAARGPVTFGGEFIGAFVPNAFLGGLPAPGGALPPGVQPVGNLFAHGSTVQVLYFLTPGDHHPANKVLGGLDRVVPVSSFRPCSSGTGLGAWEVGLRYDRYDGRSGGIQSAILDAFTVGVNWYLNPNAKLQGNYVYTYRNTGTAGTSGPIHAFGIRAAFDF